ncbi:MAG: hypothetical protein ACE5H4_14410 [Candidatus Thorarchaeota archaeon]
MKRFLALAAFVFVLGNVAAGVPSIAAYSGSTSHTVMDEPAPPSSIDTGQYAGGNPVGAS